MGWLNAISTANRETRNVEAADRQRETEIRNLHRMRQQDSDAAVERKRQADAKAAAGTNLPDFAPMDDGSGFAPYAPAAPATPSAPVQQPAASFTQEQIRAGQASQHRMRNTTRDVTPNQSSAETARLAAYPVPRTQGKLATSGYDAASAGSAISAAMPQRAASDRVAQMRRREALARANPSAGSTTNESTAEASRLLSRPVPAAPAGGPADFEAFKSAIFGQESSNGAADTSRPNYAGALGKGQILESTFNGLKASGKLPSNYDWRNPAHNEAGAVAYMQEAWQAAGGDPRMAAAYYYGGPKAIAGGKINTYRDLKNPRAPDTNGYADQVMARIGRSAPAAPSTGASPAVQVAAAPAAEAAPAPAVAPGLPVQQAALPADAVGGRGAGDNQDMRILRMQMAELRARAPYAKTAEEAYALRDKMSALVASAQQIQVRNTAAAALEDNGALTSLARAASAPFAQTAQGFVLVQPDAQGNWRPASRPVDRATLITHLVSVVTGSGAAQAAEQRKYDADTNKALVVEQQKGLNALRAAAAKHQFNMQMELAKNQLNEQDVLGIESNQMTGQQLVRTRRGVFELVPGADLGEGMRGSMTMRPVAVQ
jgi:hypothetical protein